MSNGYHIMTDEEANEYIERALLRQLGKAFREDGKDSVAQIEHDFPSLFGGEGKA